jgi:hypothetical protein
MAVTSDNKLLLCNGRVQYPRVFIYKDCKTYEGEISFEINTTALSVHGTTAILLGILLNDISPS